MDRPPRPTTWWSLLRRRRPSRRRRTDGLAVTDPDGPSQTGAVLDGGRPFDRPWRSSTAPRTFDVPTRGRRCASTPPSSTDGTVSSVLRPGQVGRTVDSVRRRCGCRTDRSSSRSLALVRGESTMEIFMLGTRIRAKPQEEKEKVENL